MIIKCKSCHADIEVPDTLLNGQAVRCPYCQTKFIYETSADDETRDKETAQQSSAGKTIAGCVAGFWASVLPFCRHALHSLFWGWRSMLDFGGRMPRREYLEFAALHYLGMDLFWRCAVVNDFVGKDSFASNLLLSIYWIMSFTLVSATVRRLHDTNRTGKWLLILIPIAIAVDSTVNNWLPLDEIALFVIGLIRTRDEGNSYSPLRGAHWPLVALMVIPSWMVIAHIVELCSSQKDAPPCRQYTASDLPSRFDSSIGVTKEGAFGFMWGEWPLSKEHKSPCKVKYRVADVWNLYSEVELYYGEKGLSSFTFYGYGDQEIEGLPPSVEKRATKCLARTYGVFFSDIPKNVPNGKGSNRADIRRF